jgi:nicotinamidase-related amidase
VPDPRGNPDLHGTVPDTSNVELVIVDVLNPLDFEGSDAFVPRAVSVGRSIALKARASSCGIPTIYVNDNVGRGRCDLEKLVAACTSDEAPGAPLARLLVPGPDDYVVLKPKHSGFYSTTLDTLLTVPNDCTGGHRGSRPPGGAPHSRARARREDDAVRRARPETAR